MSISSQSDTLPPPYMVPEYTCDFNQQHESIENNCQQLCSICKNKRAPMRDIGPHMIQHSEPFLAFVCPCAYKAHMICLKNYGVDYICHKCNYIYPAKKCVCFAQFISFICHLLSVLSVIGLFFGLSRLGEVLNELALGSNMGARIDGDEKWQDNEMKQIAEWLDIVHYSTGFAGEAMLGLVYIVGACLVIGFDHTMTMIANVTHIKFDTLYKSDKFPKKVRMICVVLSLFIFGIISGTYLLFFSWVWSCSLHQLRKKALNVNVYTKTGEIV